MKKLGYILLCCGILSASMACLDFPQNMTFFEKATNTNAAGSIRSNFIKDLQAGVSTDNPDRFKNFALLCTMQDFVNDLPRDYSYLRVKQRGSKTQTFAEALNKIAFNFQQDSILQEIQKIINLYKGKKGNAVTKQIKQEPFLLHQYYKKLYEHILSAKTGSFEEEALKEKQPFAERNLTMLADSLVDLNAAAAKKG